jgi:iron complex outermembrane recepter protein
MLLNNTRNYFILGVAFCSTVLLSLETDADENSPMEVESLEHQNASALKVKKALNQLRLATTLNPMIESEPAIVLAEGALSETSPTQTEPAQVLPTPDSNQSQPQSQSEPESVIKLKEVEVKAQRRRIITPLPGLAVDRGISTTNIQSASGKEIAESKALNVTDFMNNNMQSVSVTDYAGNPFQQDLNFRGFTASPSIGTPQGISVYMDGVRINEPFGEIVNWDLIPMNALASLDLIPGSNPMFGLNTLGGALALRTKTGFTDEHARAQILDGSWGREQVQVSNGINDGRIGLFTAYSHFKEDGWRDDSPSNIRQLYNQLTIKLPYGEINASALNVDSKLVGNGLLPFETANKDRSSVFTSPEGKKFDRDSVFTSPDESSNEMSHYNLNGQAYLSDSVTLSGLVYKRKVKQSAINGDIYDGYNGLQQRVDDVEYINGVFNLSGLEQGSKGLALQMAFDADKHQIVIGATLDKNHIKFNQGEMYGEIDDKTHQVNPARPEAADDAGLYAARYPVIRNDLKGDSETKSIFFTDTWSPFDNLHITYGTRFNWTNVNNTLLSDKGNDLYQFEYDPSRPYRPGSLLDPARQRCQINSADIFARFVCSKGDYDYRSFNPAVGVAWEATPELTTYGNISRGARTPTVIELGCATDKTKDNQPASTNYQYGCSIPTSLSSDPYLKQVRSTSYETGLRGSTESLQWNLGLFRTELQDDILFVPLGRKNRGVFDNFGKTLRQGIEMGLDSAVGKSRLHVSYTFMKATFESAARTINESNSSNTAPITLQAYNNIEPGDELPGLPNHIVQANWNYQFNDRFDASLGMVMHSSAFVRGNENNEHKPRDATNAIGGGANRDPNDYIGKGKTAGYTVFNLRANYKFDHGITLFAKVDNLFNKKYTTAGDLGRNSFNSAGAFITDSNTWNKTTFIGPGAPLAAWVGLSFDLDWTTLKKQNKK